jgi:alginate O-acetyltransferase complex protein AlgI
MAKKILLANPMGHIADATFDAGPLRAVDAWFGLVGYAFQIYFDFSGYSDMAIGLALMLGFVLIQNFESPYKARSITEFWRRWHISLSNWLRDYLYIPLGGNRRGPLRTYVNLMLVMLLGGLWHGASWNFVIWGAIHGAMLAFERARGKDRGYRGLPQLVQVACTFSVVCLAWVFVRADTLPQAMHYLGSLFGLSNAGAASDAIAGVIYTPYHATAFVLAAVVIWGLPTTWEFTARLSWQRSTSAVLALAAAVTMMWTQSTYPFLYFQF